MNSKQKAYLALCVTSIVWGTTWVAMKFGVTGMPALQLAAIRQFIGGTLFISFFMLVRKQPLPTKKQLKQLFFLSIFTFVFANGFSTWSLQYIPSGLGALIGALYPLCVVLIEYFFYNNKNINLAAVIGILLGIVGIGVVFYESAFGTKTEGYFIGLLLAGIATISWSYSTISISKQKVNINPYFGLGWQMLFGSCLMFIISYGSGSYIQISAIPTTSWAAIAYLTFAGSIIAFVAFIYSMKHLPVALASIYAYINPIIAISIGTFLLNEHITLRLVIGTIITLIGVYLVNKAMKKQVLESLPDTEGM
ncbi:MAG TPA: EamA family transporter [Chitinophagaceae bacterium]|jgi:drug/metabolite transporter (DMT)-like permease|nr:EamA family transporter [Chitinophagaceae bacterium]